LAALLLAFLAIGAPALWAQRPSETLAGQEAATRDEEAGGGFRASLGLGVGYVPDFEGADNYELSPLPIVDLRYGNFFLSSAQGLGYTILRTDNFSLAPAVSYIPGRDESDSRLLAGMGDVDGGFAAGGLMGFYTGPFSVLMDLKFGVGALEGSTVGLGAYYSPPMSGPLSARIGLGTQYASSDYNQARFGVTPAQSARSGYAAYDPGAGIKHYSLSGTLTYDLTEMINLGFFGEYRVLAGPAADSPLVKAGSENQLRTGMSIGFQLR
jgi:outer membrane scaffolding protein for murein synthesis (MipA/OmpV family)